MARSFKTSGDIQKNERSAMPVPENQVGPVPFCVGPVPETQNFTRPGDVTSPGHENHDRRFALTTGKRRSPGPPLALAQPPLLPIVPAQLFLLGASPPKRLIPWPPPSKRWCSLIPAGSTPRSS